MLPSIRDVPTVGVGHVITHLFQRLILRADVALCSLSVMSGESEYNFVPKRAEILLGVRARPEGTHSTQDDMTTSKPTI